MYDLIFFAVLGVAALVGLILKSRGFDFGSNAESNPFPMRMDNFEQTLMAALAQSRGRPLSPRQIRQLQTQMGDAMIRLRQRDGMDRASYDMKASELMGKASEAGISWTPPPF